MLSAVQGRFPAQGRHLSPAETGRFFPEIRKISGSVQKQRKGMTAFVPGFLSLPDSGIHFPVSVEQEQTEKRKGISL